VGRDRSRLSRRNRLRALTLSLLVIAVSAPAATSSTRRLAAADRWERAPTRTVVLRYRSDGELAAALRRHPARVVRTIPSLHVAEVLPRDRPQRFAQAVSRDRGIVGAEPTAARASGGEPAVAAVVGGDAGGYEWQWAATRESDLPASALAAASALTIGVVDTGADVTAPDLAAKQPLTHSVVDGGSSVVDRAGHGTFVAALAAGSPTNGDGMAGFGGDAKLIVVQASADGASFTDVDEAAGIVWAVDHGARIVNLSLGGPDTSDTERQAIDYAVAHGALLVAAAGNEYAEGNPVDYPAALLQPPGSNGQGGVGLSVGASDETGARASFSNTGSTISLVAPGVAVFSALSSTAGNSAYARVALPGSLGGLYGYGSGTSFATPEVAGAAAIVWAANPALTAAQVAEILKRSASGNGAWNDQVGYGVLDVAKAYALAAGQPSPPPSVHLATAAAQGRDVRLAWSGTGAAAYRLSVREQDGSTRVLIPSTTDTTATFHGLPGRSYAFTVDALDTAGAAAATSTPTTVQLAPAAARLTLTATRPHGKAPLRIATSARIAAGEGAGSAGRVLVLQVLDGAGWRNVTSAPTDPAGGAAWRLTLRAGLYRLRVRFAGAGDLAPATSPVVTLRVS